MSKLEEELLRALAPPPLPEDVHSRLLAHSARLATAPGAGIAALLSTKLAVAGAVGAIGVAGAVGLAPIAEPVRTLAPPAPAAVAPPPRRVAVPAPEPLVVSLEALPAEVPRPQRRAKTDPLREESELVTAMQTALGRGEASRALSLAREHERRFASGQLGTTVRVLSARALESLGETAEAKREAARLVEQDPSSVHASEARRVIGE